MRTSFYETMVKPEEGTSIFKKYKTVTGATGNGSHTTISDTTYAVFDSRFDFMFASDGGPIYASYSSIWRPGGATATRITVAVAIDGVLNNNEFTSNEWGIQDTAPGIIDWNAVNVFHVFYKVPKGTHRYQLMMRGYGTNALVGNAGAWTPSFTIGELNERY